MAHSVRAKPCGRILQLSLRRFDERNYRNRSCFTLSASPLADAFAVAVTLKLVERLLSAFPRVTSVLRSLH